jgi:hypothetical protein
MFNPNLPLLFEPYVSGYHANHVVFSITLIKTPSRPPTLLVWQILKRSQMECEGCYILCPSIYLHVYVFERQFMRQSICHFHSLCTSSLCPPFLSHCFTDFTVIVRGASFASFETRQWIWHKLRVWIGMCLTAGGNCSNHIHHEATLWSGQCQIEPKRAVKCTANAL